MLHPELPQALEMERATLGAILMNRDAITAVVPWLRAGHFYLEGHARIYAAMLACYERREPPDIRIVAQELMRRGHLEPCGGIPYLADLDAPTSHHIAYYARHVEQTARLRELIAVGGEIAALGYQDAISADDAEAQAMTLLSTACQHETQDDLVLLRDLAGPLWEAITSGAPPATPTGFADVDHLLGGLFPGDLILIAARPTVGKTSFALSLAQHQALTNHPVLFFSLEMSRAQLLQRFVSMRSNIPLKAIRERAVSEDQLGALAEALGVVSEWPVVLCDIAGQTPSSIRARTMRHLAEYPESIVIVDYLQLMTGQRRNENRVQEVGEISRSLKVLARDANVPIIALSQLSRAVEGRASRTPQLSDLRESGALEQDADVVIFLHREDLYTREQPQSGICDVIVAKHRQGPTGIAQLHFDNATTRFASLYRP